MIDYIIKDDKKIKVENINNTISSRKTKTLLINNKYYLRKNDIVIYNCSKCGLIKQQRFAFNNKFYNNEILCRECLLKNNNLKKYGVKHVLQSKLVRRKIEKTNLKKYGNICSLHNKKIKEKTKKTLLYSYGVDNPWKSEKIKNKIKQTMLNRYGVENAFKSEEIKNKIKQTMLKKYKNEYYMQNNKNKQQFKQTMMNKYGVENPSQVPEFHNKAMSSIKTSFKMKQINEELHYQSIPELNFINECRNNNIEVWDGPSIPYYLDGKKHIYYIDFETDKWLIEIKGSHKWYYRDLESGVLGAKNEAAGKYADRIGKEFRFLLDIEDYNAYINIY